MSRKRKTEPPVARMDEADRTMYSSFCAAANSLSLLYTQSMSQQKLSFAAGERHALEQLGQWIMRKHDEESRPSLAEIVDYIQHQINYGSNEASPRSNSVGHHAYNSAPYTNTAGQSLPTMHGQPMNGLVPRSAPFDQQSKGSFFSNALSSPVRRSLQPYQLTQSGNFNSTGAAGRSDEANSAGNNRELNAASSNDTSMDMVSDSPAQEYY